MTCEPRREPEILNPRYAGATPQMVAAALLRPKTERKTEADNSKMKSPMVSEEDMDHNLAG
ncbi:MAG: hypothetical protein OXH79_02325 [Boseongicola sp.]|nr:hypothetical protein [Boseongicola sp.]